MVEGLHDTAKSIDLTKARIATTVRSRLRAARVYTDEVSAPYVYVNFNVVGAAFSLDLRLYKWMFDWASARNGVTSAWETGLTGTYGGQGGDYIISTIAESTDAFVDEYLRVNEEAC